MRQDSPTRESPASNGSAALHCYHCGDPVPHGTDWQTLIDGEARRMCCAGCEAIARAIVEAGLDDYYRMRSELPTPARDRVPQELCAPGTLASPAVERLYTRDTADDLREARLLLTGIECAACAWLVERRLLSAAGVSEAAVNFSTHRARVRWDPRSTDLGALVQQVQDLGYGALPYDPARGEAAIDLERSDRLRRLGVAGLFGMQVMMVAVALYAGAWWGMERPFEQLFRWFSLALCVPVVGYSAMPFFRAALRGLANRAPGMDLPVALGIAIAFGGSVWATLLGRGHVYFDSVVMFTFALLLARYLELLARRRAHRRVEALVAPTPQLAHRVGESGEYETIPAVELREGERIRVRPGETIPADGTLLSGPASVDESLLSGESRPLTRESGHELLAGSVNIDQPIEMRVARVGPQTVLSGIVALVERAAAQRPRLVMLADRIASMFVVVVVLLAAVVGVTWYQLDPQDWLSPTIAVLVVTCPCALSLATPTSLTAAATLISHAGLIPSRGLALEPLTGVDRVVFDKTGTLTTGLSLRELRPLGDLPAEQCLRIAAAIERDASHPVATVLRELWHGPAPLAREVHHHPGQGMQALVEGRRWFLGTPAWILSRQPAGLTPDLLGALEADGSSVVLLADDRRVVCAFCLGDRLRSDAAVVVAQLRQQGIAVTLLSGDRPAAVAHVAGVLGIEDAHAQLLPHEKLERVKNMHRAGETVVMVGDGINDAPVLAAASVSIAMAQGAQLARASADFILVNARLSALPRALEVARCTRRIIGQNLAWAVGYNVAALPAAALGYVAPWAAAVGMSLSSLLVIGNSYRLYRLGEMHANRAGGR